MSEHALAALIRRTCELNGWSETEVSRRAQHAGHKLSKSNVNRIRNEPVVSLTATTIRGLAAGLGVAPIVVVRAAVAAMGFADDTTVDGGVEYAIGMDVGLSERDKRVLLATVHEMRK